MPYFKRRDFLKKSVLSTAFFAGGLKLFSENTKAINYTTDFPKDNDPEYWKKIRAQFILSNDRIYINTASLGPSPKSVIDTITDWTIKLETICETGHEEDIHTNEKIAKLLNAEVEEIAITRNTTEGINSVTHCLPFKEGDEIIMTKDEHVGGASPWVALAKEKGVKIKLVDLDYTGENNLTVFKNAITEKTKAVMFSHVTCSTGMILPAKEIVALCRSKNIYTCVDGAQAVGMIDINLKDINPDFYASSGHKWLLGPKGTGILFINKNIIGKINPVYVGAYTDKKFDLNNLELEYLQSAQREEYGTRNTAITIALGKAVDFITEIGIKKIEERERELAAYFKNELVKNKKIELLTPLKPEYSCAIVTFRIKNKNYNEVQKELQEKYKFRVRGIYENKLDAIRISCSVHNNMDELKSLVEAINAIANS